MEQQGSHKEDFT